MTAVDLPDRLQKRLAPLGHHLALLAEALATLRGRQRKGRLSEALAAHVGLCLDWLPEEALPEQFEVTLQAPADALEDWKVLPAPRPWPLTPAACALLHLPGLRALWAGWLRGSVLEDLRQRLPRAWVVDHAAMPSHGAIAGLGLAAWEELARWRTSGRAFDVRFAEDAAVLALRPEGEEKTWQEAARRLADTPPGKALVLEATAGSVVTWRAAFARSQQRWERIEGQAGD